MSAASSDPAVTHGRQTLRILLVGEGNLSFTHALVKRVSGSVFFSRWNDHPQALQSVEFRNKSSPQQMQCAILATTFDSEMDLIARYPEVLPVLAYIQDKKRIHVRYVGCVNATAMEQTLAPHELSGWDPSLIIFNNPHVGYEDLYRQRSLISHFFASALVMPRRSEEQVSECLPRQVALALCDDQPWRWGMLEAAARNGFICVAAVPLLGSDFPEYENKRHQSDAAFPYETMVHYYFVEISVAKSRGLVEGLRNATQDWPLREKHSTFASRCDLAQWEGIAKGILSQLASTPSEARDRGESVTAPDVSARQRKSTDHLSLHDLPICTCFPLLHPQLFYSGPAALTTDKSFTEQRSSEKTGKGVRHLFSPYVDVSLLPQLYACQRAVELSAVSSGRNSGTQQESEGSRVAIPSTLDTAVLGRPLTQREAVKLERFLKKASQRSNGCDRPAPRTIEGELAAETRCPYCTGAEGRFFRTRGSYETHVLAKHSGAAELLPNMHARVHEQIILHGSPPFSEKDKLNESLLEAHALCADGPSSTAEVTNGLQRQQQRYCGVCDLLFRNREAYLEHLEYLSPHASQFLCEQCEEPRSFPDERALEQHKALKHADRPASDVLPSEE